MLTWSADNQFAIIGCAQLLRLRALARDMPPTSTGPWTEAPNGTRICGFFLGCLSMFSIDWLGVALCGLAP